MLHFESSISYALQRSYATLNYAILLLYSMLKQGLNGVWLQGI